MTFSIMILMSLDDDRMDFTTTGFTPMFRKEIERVVRSPGLRIAPKSSSDGITSSASVVENMVVEYTKMKHFGQQKQ